MAKSLSKLFEAASSISIDDTSENQIFFVAPRAAYDSEVLELSQFNYHVLSTLMEAKKGFKLNSVGIEDEMLSLFRNYFSTKAQGSLNVNQAFYCLKGLKSLGDQVFLTNVDEYDHVTFDGSKNELRYSVVDWFGNPSKVKSIK